MPILIHHLRLSASERLLWLCEELSIPYEFKTYDRDPQTKLAPPAYKALHPSQTSPVMEDGEGENKLVLAEAAACIEYIIQTYGGGRLMRKPGEPGYADFLFWWHYGQGSLQPAVLSALFTSGLPDTYPGKMFASKRTEVAMKFMEDRLGKVPYLAGDEFTAADIVSLFYFTTSRAFSGADLSAWPNILRWVELVGGRPAYAKAMEKGDPGFKPLLQAKPDMKLL